MRMNIKYVIMLLAACLLLLPYTAGAQVEMKPEISGKVTDAEGNPMFQVGIFDDTGKIIGSTDLFGVFRVKSSSGKLSFRAAGYTDISMPVELEEDMNVTMSADHARLDEVLDYGYNVLRRRMTASEAVSTVEGSTLEDIPTANFSQMISGQLPGLGTLETSSDLGNASVAKYVRGVSTVNNTSPLIVIDGIVMQDYNIDYLTAAEIENIVLLKDAAATAIYGLRGANGVLVINTKKGIPGSFDVRVTADFSMQQIGLKPQMLSSLEYATLRNQAWANDGSNGSAPFSDYQMEQIRAGNDPLYPNHDYYREFVRNFATMERVGVSLSGGSERVRVWSNVNFMSQTSLLKQETDEYIAAPRRFWINFRAKVDVDISKRIRAFASIAGNIRNDRLSGGYDLNGNRISPANNDIYTSIFSLPPTMMGPVTDDGRVTTMENVPNPTYGMLNRSGYTKYNGMYASTQAGMDFDMGFITRGLSVTAKIDFQSSNDRYNYYSQDYSRYYYDYTLGDFVKQGANIDTSLDPWASGTFQYALSYIGQLDYKREFGKHDVEGHVYSYYTEEQFNRSSADYPAVGFPYYNHNTGINLSYGFDDRYVVAATLGFTASDALPRKNRYTFVPAVSAAWIVSNEAFLKDAEWLSFLKARVSYGEVATDDFAVGDYRYLYEDYIIKSGEIRLLGNPDLMAEKHRIQNYGIDVGLWNKLDFSFDWFRRRTDNMLIDSGDMIPAYQGIYVSNYMKVNDGAMLNSGLELCVDYTTRIGRNWTLRAGAGWSHAENKVLNTLEQPYPSAVNGVGGFAFSHRIDGYPMGQQFGYLIDRSNGSGYISTADELAKYTVMYTEIGTPRMGDFIYTDVNGDGVINQKDMSPIGRGSVPTDFTTIRLGFGWKGIDVDLMMQGVTGFWGRVDYATDATANGIYNDLHLKAWTAGRAASGAGILAPALSYSTPSVSSLDNDYLITKRSFWRLKNASISYTLPAKIMRNSGIKRLKIVLSGQNLFTVSALASKVVDPESGSMTVLPPMRVVNLGVKIDF